MAITWQANNSRAMDQAVTVSEFDLQMSFINHQVTSPSHQINMHGHGEPIHHVLAIGTI